MQVEGSARTGTVSDLFDLFTYTSATDSYKCETVLLTVISGYTATIDYLEVTFKDGKIAGYTISMAIEVGKNTTRSSGTYVISDYNQTVVTLPEGLVEYIESLK